MTEQERDELLTTLAERMSNSLVNNKEEHKAIMVKVDSFCARIKEGEDKHDKLENRVWLLIGILGGSGILGGTVVGLNQLLK